MKSLETYLKEILEIRASGAAVKETTLKLMMPFTLGLRVLPISFRRLGQGTVIVEIGATLGKRLIMYI
jgi:hypothetical protein